MLQALYRLLRWMGVDWYTMGPREEDPGTVELFNYGMKNKPPILPVTFEEPGTSLNDKIDP